MCQVQDGWNELVDLDKRFSNQSIKNVHWFLLSDFGKCEQRGEKRRRERETKGRIIVQKEAILMQMISY
jgi:hypothetical protein